MNPLPSAAFWSGRRVLLTGHTGFKGGWAALWLRRLGASVTGLALPPDDPSLFALAAVADTLDASHLVDLRDADAVTAAVHTARPDIVLHLAAQPLVRQALADPVDTFATNVMGTLHLLQALRGIHPPSAVLVVTTDKVYAPPDRPLGYTETDALGGGDPYAASKAACEIAVATMVRNYLAPAGIAVATARAGNVVGGGDFAADRLIPDLVRAARAGCDPVIRHPAATRPWQHVLDCLCGYLLQAEALATRADQPGTLNFGPQADQSLSVGDLAATMLRALGVQPAWRDGATDTREAPALTLDATLARRVLGWRERLAGPALIETTAAWYRAWADGADMHRFTLDQIATYEALP